MSNGEIPRSLSARGWLHGPYTPVAVHHVLDRPRNVPFRTGIGMAARVMVIAGPVLAFFVGQSPEGGFDEVSRPVSAQERAVKETARGLANRAFVDMAPLPPGVEHNGDGHNGDGRTGPAPRPSTDGHR